MSVSPKEAAQHLIEELGYNQAYRECEYRKSIFADEFTHRIWSEIGSAMNSIKPGDQRA